MTRVCRPIGSVKRTVHRGLGNGRPSGSRLHARHCMRDTVRILVEEGLTLAGVRRVFELEAQVAALEAELARERARHTDRRS